MITAPVFSSVNVPVEKEEISAAQRRAGHHRAIQPRAPGWAEAGEGGFETFRPPEFNYSSR